MLMGMNVLTDEDRLRFDNLYMEMRDIMEVWLYVQLER